MAAVTERIDQSPDAAATRDRAPSDPPDIIAAVLAFLVPGLGHAYRRRPARGGFVAAGVLGMVLAGTLIGGIDVIDSEEDRWWYYGQAPAGPVVFAINWYNQNATKGSVVETGRVFDAVGNARTVERLVTRSLFPGEAREIGDLRLGDQTLTNIPVIVPAEPGERPPKTVSLGKVNEIGTLYVLCAGMLNLIAIFDAFFPGRHAPRRRTRSGAAAKEASA